VQASHHPRAPLSLRTTLSRAQSQYLDRYAEPEASLARVIRGRFAHVLTIPAYDEGNALLDTLASIPAGPLGDVLTIVVINGRVDSPHSTREANLAMLERLRSDFGSGKRIANGLRMTEHSRGALLLIEWVATVDGRMTVYTVLLTGAIFNAFSAALIYFIQSVASLEQLQPGGRRVEQFGIGDCQPAGGA